MNANTRPAAARAFVRSLNILLKFARMYDFGHPRTVRQYETAWQELRTALGTDNGVLLAVSGDQLLLDGSALESAAAEKNFARMLSAAGIASIYFSPKTTQASLARFVRGFPTSHGSKPLQLAEQLKAALQGDPHIHVNEVCYVPADSAVAKSTIAAQLASRTLGMSSAESDELFKDPERLLQLIVAAEGTKDFGGPGSGGTADRNGPGSGTSDSEFAGGAGGGPSISTHGTAGSAGHEAGYGGSGSGGSGSGSGYGSGYGVYSGGSPHLVDRWSDSAAAGSPAASPNGDATGAGMDGSSASASAPGEMMGGSALEGPVKMIRSSNGRRSGSGTWNIIGAGGGGTPLDPNAGGFWLKDGPADASVASGSGPIGGVVAEPIAILGNGLSSAATGTGGPIARSSGAGGGAMAGPGGSGAGGGSRARWTPGADVGSGTDKNLPSRWGNASTRIRGSHSARGSGAGAMAVETGLMTLQEDELQGILQVLAQIARTGDASKDKLDPGSFQSRLSTLPRRARFTVSQALSALAAQAPSESEDKPTLLKLAEHIAVRFALEAYDRGDVKVNSVQHVLEEMSQELDGLRKILGVYEEKMARAGLQVQSHNDLLAQEFWTKVSDEKKKSVLESPEAWCVPPAKTREYVELLFSRGETEAAENILRNYANGITLKSVEARRHTATGLAELASLYAKSDDRLLVNTIRLAGVQLAEEQDSELQSLVGAAFVRLSQEAAKKRSYAAIQRSVELMDYVESERPEIGKNLRPRIAIENRLPEFIEEALRTGEMPGGLAELLRRVPQPAAQHLAVRFSRAGFREDCELLVSMMQVLGPPGLEHLREQLRSGAPGDAIDAIGILARVDLENLELLLPPRMKEWKRAAHDRVVRQIASSGAPERGRLLLEMLDYIDSMIRPLAVDEIGMSGEQSANMRLLRIAEGDLPKGGTEYLRLKAIEAIGRLRTTGAEAVLRKIAELRKTWRWASASELRLVAAQAMEKIDPEWTRSFIPRSGLSVAEFSIVAVDADPSSSAMRQRRYPRLRLEHPVPATTVNLKENCRVEIPELTLGGGVAICEQSLHPGSIVGMRLNTAQKSIKAQTIVRDANTQARAFEVVEMDLDERAKLRKLLVQLGNSSRQSSPQERNRRNLRTLLTNSA